MLLDHLLPRFSSAPHTALERVSLKDWPNEKRDGSLESRLSIQLVICIANAWQSAVLSNEVTN